MIYLPMAIRLSDLVCTWMKVKRQYISINLSCALHIKSHIFRSYSRSSFVHNMLCITSQQSLSIRHQLTPGFLFRGQFIDVCLVQSHTHTEWNLLNNIITACMCEGTKRRRLIRHMILCCKMSKQILTISFWFGSKGRCRIKREVSV